MYLYRAFGLTFASEIHCPELRAAEGPADVTVHLARPANQSANGARPASGFDAVPGLFDLRVPRVGRFVVARGRSITIEPDPAADEDTLRLFLFGTAVGALLHQRELLPLHGSAVFKDGRTLLVLGASGAGKSSLAAALGRHGWRLQSDDVSVVRLEHGQAWCDPAFPRRKMWPDMLKQLGDDPKAHAPVRPGLEKRSQIVDAAQFHDAPAPVGGIVVLRPSRALTPTLTPLAGPARMACLKHQTFRANLRTPLDVHVPHFAIIARLAEQARVWRLQRPRSSGSPVALAEVLAPALLDWSSREESAAQRL